MENGPFEDVFLLKVVIFHCYASLLEGKTCVKTMFRLGCGTLHTFLSFPAEVWHMMAMELIQNSG